MSYKGITKEDLETMRRNGMSFGEEQQLFWEKEDYLEVDKDKEIERLQNKVEELYLDLQDTNSQLADYAKRFIKTIKYIEEHTYKYYDTQFNEYVEETAFESNTSPKELLEILKGSDKE